MLRRALTVQLTRFDQRASGLIQQVPFASDSAVTGRRMQYVAQNVGEISNHGWELGATSTCVAADDERVVRVGGQPSAPVGAGIHRRPRDRRSNAAGPGDHGEPRRDVDGRRRGLRPSAERGPSTGSTTTRWRSRGRALREPNRSTAWSGPDLRSYWRRIHGWPAPARERLARHSARLLPSRCRATIC